MTANDIIAIIVMIILAVIVISKSVIAFYRWVKPDEELIDKWSSIISFLVNIHRITRHDYTVNHIDKAKKESFVINVKKIEYEEPDEAKQIFN